MTLEDLPEWVRSIAREILQTAVLHAMSDEERRLWLPPESRATLRLLRAAVRASRIAREMRSATEPVDPSRLARWADMLDSDPGLGGLEELVVQEVPHEAGRCETWHEGTGRSRASE